MDWVRAVVAIFGGMILATCVFLLRDWKKLTIGMPQRFRYLSLLLYGLLSAVQEVQQFGEPMLMWRLPLIVLAASFAIYGLYGESWNQVFRRRPFTVLPGFEWPTRRNRVKDVDDATSDLRETRRRLEANDRSDGK